MAIQLPDPGNGVPEDQTGDNEHVMWLKTRANFSDQNNAASRLVGIGTGQVPVATTEGVGGTGWGAAASINITTLDTSVNNGCFRASASAVTGLPSAGLWALIRAGWDRNARADIAQIVNTANPRMFIRSSSSSVFGNWAEVYTTVNTTKDSNGFIKAASPIVKVFADKVELNSDAVSQGVTFVRNGIGDYTITTVSGLSTDGWYIELPKDINGNPKVAVTLTETDGIISLKCYKRIFSMTTFTFVPDLDEPMDVPDGRWIDLRLNDIVDNEPTEPLE